MVESELQRLQKLVKALESENQQLRLQLGAGFGVEGRMELGGARTTPVGQAELYLALDKTRMPMVLTDPNRPDNPIIFANSAFQELTGYDASEIIGRNCRFLQGPETDMAQIAAIRKGLEENTDIIEEIKNYRKDGSAFTNKLYISPILDHDGRLLYHFASQLDVTATNRDLKLVADAQIRHRAIFNSATDLAIVAMDGHGTITDWNTGATTILGWEPQEIIGQRADCFFTPEDRSERRLEYEMQQALADGKVINERWHVRKSGARFWASGTMLPLLGADNNHLGFLRVVRDRTEQHIAGERLAESEARYRSLFEALDAGFCVLEVHFNENLEPADYRFIEVNPAFERQTGLLGAAGKMMRSLSPNHEQHWFDTYGRVALTGEPARFENAADALGRWFDVHAFRVGDPRNHRVAVLFDDITSRRKTEGNLQALTASLEEQVQVRTAELMAAEEALRQSQKMEAVGQLTGGLAHDFNNLLTGITGSLELLQTRVAQGRVADAERYIAAAQGAATRAAALTHRLLAFSRRQTLDPQATDLNRLAVGMDELIRRTVGPAISLRMILAEDLWATLVDPFQLENALLNLCINARDAMPDGGRITVETSNTVLDNAAARERELPPGDFVSLFVSDTGTGMEQDVIQRAFDPFFTTKPIGAGTGLGLSMIYGFTKQSGGQVRIHSKVGFGTTVRLYLPRLVGSGDFADGEKRLVSELTRTGTGETVLVVDDEEVVRMVIVEVLEDLGYQALEANDARSAIKILDKAKNIDLLVTDVGLPGGLNGRQLADAVRVKRPDLKVLFITGFAESAAVGNGQMEPGMAVLTKPFSVDVLAVKIQAMIGG